MFTGLSAGRADCSASAGLGASLKKAEKKGGGFLFWYKKKLSIDILSYKNLLKTIFRNKQAKDIQ